MKRKILLLTFLLTCTPLRAQQGQKQLETARSLEQEQRYEEAVTAYLRLIDSKPDEEVLLQAKLHVGRIYLEVKKEIAKARPYFEDGIKSLKYPEVAALSTVYNGRALVMSAVSEKDFDAALGEFDTVIRTYPNSQAVVEALISGGTILEMQHKYDRAKINYQSIVSQFPDSDKVPQAFVQLGRTLGKQGNIGQALEAYQNVQLRYQGKDPATIAEDEATLLYRLFLLKKTSPAIFKASVVAEKSKTFRLEDPYMMNWSSGKLHLLDAERVFSFTASGEAVPASGPAGQFISPKGEVYRFLKSSLIMSNQQPLNITYMKDGKREPFDEITAVAVNQYGDTVVATHGPDGLFRVNRETGDTTPFTVGESKAKKIAVDSEGNFYVLNEAQNGLTMFDARGKSLAAIQSQAVGHKEIVDFALDTFDNIYLLDKEGQFAVMGGLNQTADVRLKPIHKQQITENSKSTEAKPMKELRAVAVLPNGTVFVVSKQALLSFQ